MNLNVLANSLSVKFFFSVLLHFLNKYIRKGSLKFWVASYVLHLKRLIFIENYLTKNYSMIRIFFDMTFKTNTQKCFCLLIIKKKKGIRKWTSTKYRFRNRGGGREKLNQNCWKQMNAWPRIARQSFWLMIMIKITKEKEVVMS